MWRDNDAPGSPWSAPTLFGQALGRVDSLTLIQSNIGVPGSLELVARVGDTLQYFERDASPTSAWRGPQQIATGATGNPVLIQSRFGVKGNFELAYPAVGGGIRTIWRNNDVPDAGWSAPAGFGLGLGRVDGLSLIQGNFGVPGNLEVVARVGTALHSFWRDSGPGFNWAGPQQIATGALGDPVLIQSRFGVKGNFELAFPAVGGGFRTMWRNNDVPGSAWSGPTTIAQAIGPVDALTFIQGRLGQPGNFELVVRQGDSLKSFWRDSGPSFTWAGPTLIL